MTVLAPCAALAVLVISLNLVTDGIARALGRSWSGRRDGRHEPDGSRGGEQEPLVTVEGLTIDFWSNDRWNNVVNGASF